MMRYGTPPRGRVRLGVTGVHAGPAAQRAEPSDFTNSVISIRPIVPEWRRRRQRGVRPGRSGMRITLPRAFLAATVVRCLFERTLMTPQARRLSALRRVVAKGGVQAMLVSSPYNVRYFSGFTGEDSYLLVGRTWATLLTD